MVVSRVAVTVVMGFMVVTSYFRGAQDYPNKPIRIVTAGRGGSGDFTARLIAQGISGPWASR